MLRNRTFALSANIAIAAYERLIAFGISACLAVCGAWYLFGHVALDLTAGGANLLRIVVGVVVTSLAGATFVWGRSLYAALVEHLDAEVFWFPVRSTARA